MERVGPYLLEHRLGRGAMGEVWAARHVERDWEVALKRVRVRSGDRGDPLSEVRAVAALSHPHVVRLLDFGRDGPDLFLVMERAATNLARRLPESWDEARLVLGSLLTALAHTHARGMVHLDVKPENLLRHQHPGGYRWVLSDFGLARAAATADGDDRPRGTPSYMAPEQFEPDPTRWGPTTDLYAVGCVASVLVSGTAPFEGTTVEELRRAHQSQEPILRVQRFPIPPGFVGWWERLVAKRPEDRFPLAADALEALEQLTTDQHNPAARTDSAPQPLATFVFDEAEPGEPQDDDPEPLEPWRPEVETVARLVPDASLIDVRTLPLIGRLDALARLTGALAQVARGPSGVVVLRGPLGVGRRHLARSFAWASEERGAARVLRRGDEPLDRPGILWVDTDVPDDRTRATDALALERVLVLAIGDGSLPGPLLDTLSLDPLPRGDAARLLRILAPLDETLVAELSHTLGGHPGRLIATIRGWAVEGRLVPSPAGLILDPSTAGPVQEEAGGDEDPLAGLAWTVEEDPDEALRRLDPELATAAQRGHGRVLWLVGLGERALARASDPDPAVAWRIARLHAQALVSAGHPPAALAAARKAVLRARALGTPEALATSLLLLAHVVRFQGEDPLPLLAEAEALAPDPATTARARATRGSELIRAGRLDEAIEVLRSAEALLVSAGVKTFLGTTRFWLANALSYRGDLEEAFVAEGVAADTFREVGSAAGESHARLVQGLLALDLGRMDDARAALAQAAEAVARADSPWLDAELLGLTGAVLEQEGRLDEALRTLEDATQRLAESALPMGGHRRRLARVLLRLGRREEALRQLAEADHAQDREQNGVEGAVWSVVSLPPGDPRWGEAADRLASSTLRPPMVDLLRDVARDQAHVARVVARLWPDRAD